MGKSIIKSSRFFLILGLSLISNIGSTQDSTPTKKEQKEARKAEQLKDYEALGLLLESRQFVFVSERVQGSTGIPIYNSIHIDGPRISANLENPTNTSGAFSGAADNTSPRIGPSGLFFDGDIDKWELSKNTKNLSYSIKFEVQTKGQNTGIFYKIDMIINYNKSAGVEIRSLGGHNVYYNFKGLIRIW